MLLRRETAKATRDFRGADALRDSLKRSGVLIDEGSRTWRADDGRSGMLPPRQAAPATGHGRGQHGVAKFDEARTLCAPLGEGSYGTNTLSRIFAPFNVESVTSTRDGYAALLLPEPLHANRPAHHAGRRTRAAPEPGGGGGGGGGGACGGRLADGLGGRLGGGVVGGARLLLLFKRRPRPAPREARVRLRTASVHTPSCEQV